MSKRAKVTFELLRMDMVYAASALEERIAEAIAHPHTLDREGERTINRVAHALKHATHIIIHEADRLPTE